MFKDVIEKKINYKNQFPINLMFKDVIEKKN